MNMDVEIHSQEQRIDRIFKQVKDCNDYEMKSHLTKYLCVLVAGFMEDAVRLLLISYVESKSYSPEVKQYAATKLDKLTNLDDRNLLQIISAFSATWRTKVETKIEGEIKSALNSIIHNRHIIAHGRYNSSTISFVNLCEWYECIKKLVKFIDKSCINPR